jgi:hypothetical protein
MTLLKSKNIIYIFLIASFVITACSKSSAPKPTPPTNTKSDSVQSAIWSSDADIYFVGTFAGQYPNNQTIASVWKNGVRTALGNGTADGIAVNGPDVYISGYVGNQAAFWKNGVFTNLGHSSSQSNANAIAISGNDVYIAGWIDDKAVVWKNGMLLLYLAQMYIWQVLVLIIFTGISHLLIGKMGWLQNSSKTVNHLVIWQMLLL